MSSKFSVEKAHAMQLQLSERVICKDVLPEAIRYVAGVDISYTGDVSIGAVAVLDFNSLSLVESQTACCNTRFPYIPTLLSFREIPPAISAIKKLRTSTDVFLVDAHGVAHPYRLGFASYLGLVIDKPTIGVAKNLLCGTVEPFCGQDWAAIKDNEEIIGGAVVTKRGRKPIYVSVGHKVSLETAIKIVKHCTPNQRIPEPTRKAHIIATEERDKLKKKRM
ncbi:MAG: deoxyribonuclease V [Thermoproteota archaeon]|nr:deoxyribonuclease V [Thermoproteota archaeon]